MKTTTIHNSAKERRSGYAAFLDIHGIQCRKEGPFLFHGNALWHNCWQLYISLTVLDFKAKGGQILSLLAKNEMAFRIPKDLITHYQVNTGELGSENIGKVIVAYPQNQQMAATIAEELIDVTQHTKGITVPNAMYLGGRVYAALSMRNAKDENLFHITLPKSHPFTKNVTYPKPPKRFIGKGYIPAKLIKTGPKGDIIQAVNVRKLSFTWCLIKQGKAYAADDEYGRDIRDRLQWQNSLLNRLHGFVPVPNVLEYLEKDGDTYLVTEFVEGQLITEKCRELLIGKPYSEAVPETKLAFLGLFQQVTVILAQLHGSGIIHRDITGGNLIIDKKGAIKLIDFELAYDLNKSEPTPPFVHGTIGYVAPEQARYATPTTKEDMYAFGALLYYGLTSQHPKDALLETKRESLNRLPVYCSSPALATLVRKLLHDNPSERPDIADIQQVLGNEIKSVTSRPLERKTILHTVAFESVISLIFLYLVITGGSKLFDLRQFGYDMNAQPIDEWGKPILKYAIPYGHLGLGALLYIDRIRLYALIGILLLITGYLLYILAIRKDFFAFQPCSCTWIYKNMSYGQTFALNLTFGLWTFNLLFNQAVHYWSNKLNARKRHHLQQKKKEVIK